MDLTENLRMQSLQHRSAFEQPQPNPIAFAQTYDRDTGKYVVANGGDRMLVDNIQIAALAQGQRVDLTGRRIDYL